MWPCLASLIWKCKPVLSRTGPERGRSPWGGNKWPCFHQNIFGRMTSCAFSNRNRNGYIRNKQYHFLCWTDRSANMNSCWNHCNLALFAWGSFAEVLITQSHQASWLPGSRIETADPQWCQTWLCWSWHLEWHGVASLISRLPCYVFCICLFANKLSWVIDYSDHQDALASHWQKAIFCGNSRCLSSGCLLWLAESMAAFQET